MRKISYWLIVVSLVLIANNIWSQEMTYFEVIDNTSVGLTVTPFEKGGLALADIDRNGYPDIFCLCWHEPGYSRIYINTDGYFQDITDQSPLQQIESNEIGTCTTLWVDFDNDGDKDLSMATKETIHLLRNDDNVFNEVSEEMGFVAPKPPGWITEWDCNTCGWADYDVDGDLDCVISQLNNPNLYLFRNDGDHFTNVATESGLDAVTEDEELWRSVFTDFDLDGDPDLVGRRRIMRNDDGYFIDITGELGLPENGNYWYRRFFDYDNDGDLDFFKASRSVEEDTEFDELWENQDGVFVNVSNEVGFISQNLRHRGMTFGDFDNDGDQDIFMDGGTAAGYDNLFINDEVAPGERGFADVAEFAGIAKTGDRKGCGFFDYNRDGFLDIYMPSAEFNHILYQNSADNGANWVGFILEGTVSNRDAVGSLVTLYTPEKTQIRLTRCGDNHYHQYNPWVHFGIGYETAIDSVVIRWPLGERQTLTDVAINQYHEVKEGEETAVERIKDETTPTSFRLKQNYPNPFNPVTTIQYDIINDSHVSLTIYNLHADEIASLVNDRFQPAGSYSATWNGKDSNGNVVSSGIYVYQLRTVNSLEMKKMTLIK
ncbi:VCBS repeat-containing protein [candidate division KSB1 bacterium]|nr:VCBS repeat-containing protein [candidate division KSB1 bacterium]